MILRIDANGVIICHSLFVKHNSSKQFFLSLNRENALRKSRSCLEQYIIICQIESAFLCPDIHDPPSSTRLFGNKGEYASKKKPKNLVSPSMKCLLVVVCAIPPLTEATLSVTCDAFECSENFLSLL